MAANMGGSGSASAKQMSITYPPQAGGEGESYTIHITKGAGEVMEPIKVEPGGGMYTGECTLKKGTYTLYFIAVSGDKAIIRGEGRLHIVP